jgi:hypothetical protein
MLRNSKFVVLIIAALIVPSIAVALPANAAVLYAPTLTSPASDQILTNFPRTATFKWSAVSGATKYQLEVACDFCISKTNLWANAKTYSVNGTSYTTVVPGADNQFRWRVRAYDGATAGNWSVFRYFKFNTKISAPPAATAPVITAPTQNQVFSDINGTVTGRWTSVANAQMYQLELYKGTNKVWNGETANTSYSANLKNLSYVTVINGDYKARVRAVFAGNSYSNWSDYRYFSVSVNSSNIGKPTISEPYEGQNIGGSITHFDWSDITNAIQYNIVLERWNTYTSSWNSSLDSTTNESWEELYSNSGLTYGQFRVRVRAIFSGSVYGEWSDWRNYINTTDGSNTLLPPTVISPANQQIINSDYVTASWSAVNNAVSYEVGVNYKHNGDYWYVEGTYTGITSLSRTLGSLSANDYRVRVRAKYSDGSYTNWSEWRYFTTTNGSGSYVGVPSLITPSDESSVPSNYLTLDWSTVSDATSYAYEITRNTGSSWIAVSNDTVTASNASVYLPSGTYGQYSFRVRAIRNGNYGDWSQFNQFYYYGGSNNYGAPVINNPYNNQTYTSHSVVMNWSGVSGAVTYEVNVNYESNSNWYEEGTYSASNLTYTKYFSYDNHYRMRVRAKFSDYSYGTWSEWREFRVGDSGGNYSYGAPTIYAPTENQNYSIYSTVSFGWYASSGNVSRYDVGVEYESNGIWYAEGTYSSQNASYSKYFGYNNEYRLRVRAVFSDGSVGNWSDWRNFTVGASNSNNNNNNSYGAPVISTPTTNQYFSNNSYVTIGWNTFYSVQRYETVVEYQSGSYWSIDSNYSTTASSYQKYFNQNYNYRVKVRVVFNDNSTTNWSDYRYFSIGTTPSQNNYSIPVVISPTAGQTLYSRYVTPSWNSVANATSYELNVYYKSGNGWMEEGLHTTSATSYGLTLPNTNDYRLRVRARFSDGSYTIWTGWTEFRVQL